MLTGFFIKYQAWALAVAKDGEWVVTGGADSTLIYWEDDTQRLDLEKKRIEDETILRNQELSNLLERNEHEKALQIALDLGHV